MRNGVIAVIGKLIAKAFDESQPDIPCAEKEDEVESDGDEDAYGSNKPRKRKLKGELIDVKRRK